MDEGSDEGSAEPDQDSSTKEKFKEHVPVEADKAKNLKSKFENWQTQNNKENIRRNTDRLPSSTCRNLRAKFEAVKDETPKPKGKPPPKVNRFVVSNTERSKFYFCPPPPPFFSNYHCF